MASFYPWYIRKHYVQGTRNNNPILLVHQVVSSEKSGASPCLGCCLTPSAMKHCTKHMPLLQFMYNLKAWSTVQQIFTISSGTCTSDWRSHRVECQHLHGRISPWQRATNAWRSTTKSSWSPGVASPTYTPINVPKWTYLIQEYFYLHMDIYYIALWSYQMKEACW